MRTFGMAVFGAGLVLALACGYSTGPTYNNPGSTDPGSGSQSHNTPSISVNDGFFTPSVDTVAVGTAVTFITLIFTPWGVVIGFPMLFAAFTGWAWPRGDDHREQLMVDHAS